MERIELGISLLNWHSGQSDPIYAVGSFYLDDRRYPEVDTVQDALRNIEQDLDRTERMLRGEKVRTDRTEDLKKFAGYDDETLESNRSELTLIRDGLNLYLKQDY